MQRYPLKPEFEERMKELLDKDFDKFKACLNDRPFNSIRVNELKISVSELKERLEKKGWKLKQPIKGHPEIIVVESQLEPGEIGRTLEHLLGYYYVQEISSMMPATVLNPGKDDKVLDLCASPGSKTTQMASKMENTGLIIANEIEFNRMKILSSNLERCGVVNAVVTRKDGGVLCKRLSERDFLFDKILVDAPCSGEGTLRNNPKTAKMWNVKGAVKMPSIQKRLVSSAIKVLKEGGELVYSTCTFAPEEDEGVVDFVLDKFPEMKICEIELPVKAREGIREWRGSKFNERVKFARRIFPFESGTEGFFIAKFVKEKSR